MSGLATPGDHLCSSQAFGQLWFHQGYPTPCPADRRKPSALQTNKPAPGLCYPAKDQQELAAECRRLKSMLVPDKRPLLEISSCAHARWWKLADPEAL